MRGVATMRIDVPAARSSNSARKPQYVSSATQSVTVTPAGQARQVFALTPASPNCTAVSNGGSNLSCTLQITTSVAPAQQFIVSTYASTDGSGTALSTQTLMQDIVSGQNNVIMATLNGVVTSLSVKLGSSTVASGTATTVPLFVNGLDASGQTIVGPGVFVDAKGNSLSVALAVSGGSGYTSLSQQTVTQPTAGISLTYNGKTTAGSATVSASAPNIAATSASVQIVPTITEFNIPGGSQGSAPVSIAAGSDGALWFTESTADQIGRITTAGAITEFTDPPQPEAPGVLFIANPFGITAGPDGALWFSEYSGGRVGRITTGGAVKTFVVQAYSGDRRMPRITTGPDGALWFVENNSSTGSRVGRITTDGAITQFAAATGNPANSELGDIVTGPDGALWFTEPAESTIGRITTAGAVTEYYTSNNTQPYGITVGPDGALWFSEQGYGHGIGRITTGGVVTEFIKGVTPGSVPSGIITGPDGALWFAESAGHAIGRITTDGVVTEYGGLNPNPRYAAPAFLAVGSDGGIWFTESNVEGRIGRIK